MVDLVLKRTAETEPLAALWRRQFFQELTGRIGKARQAAESAAPGGWFRGQCEEAVRMYEAARDAANSSK